MKKIFILSLLIPTVALAVKIDFDTPLKWNANVITTALTRAGLVDSRGAHFDVIITRNRILEDLLKRDTFSLRDATEVCMDKCNMSDFLRKGLGQSHQKCPAICTSFVSNMVKVNNEQFTAIPKASAKSSEFDDLQNKPLNVCKKLASDAAKSGISFPVLCGGHCRLLRDDTILVTDLKKTKEYKVDDFCDSIGKNRDYFYVLSDLKNAKDVSSLSEQQRVTKLKEAQTKPAADYIAVKERQEKEKTTLEYGQRVASAKAQYSSEVEHVGYCDVRPVHLNGDCRRQVRKLAQRCHCKVKGYTEEKVLDNNSNRYLTNACFMGDMGYEDSDTIHYYYTQYEYAPTFEDCVATFNESYCSRSIKDVWNPINDNYDGYDEIKSSSYQCQVYYTE